MGQTTPNLGLYKPDIGETGWGDEVNANWDALDAVTSGSAFGASRVQRLLGNNNAGNPNTRYDFSADVIVLRNPSNGLIVVRPASGTLTCNLAVVGVNGLDTGVQVLNTFYHFYFIWNGATLATLASIAAPPTGPTLLPAGYTFWAYAGTVRSNASVQLALSYFRGARMFYQSANTAGSVLAAGMATAETAVNLSSVVPPNALTAQISTISQVDGGVADLQLRLVTGVNWLSQFGFGAMGAIEVPNIGQQLFYLWSAPPGGIGLYLAVMSFTVANGDAG